MELQSFNSIFELFATFFLAYVLIDELTENPFISLISEKILRKYRTIDKIFSNIRAQITGHGTSLNNIAQLEDVVAHQQYIAQRPGIDLIMQSTSQRTEQSFKEIRSSIRQNYTTRCFVYLNAYLFFYCFAILFFGGLYESINPKQPWAEDYNVRIDTALSDFLIFSFIYLFIGWLMDTKKKEKEELVEEEDKGFFKSLSDNSNGYLVAVIIFFVNVVLSACSFYFNWHIIHFEKWPNHNILVVASILLPMSNFFIYIFKASRRASKTLPTLLTQAKTFKTDYTTELNKVQGFIHMCSNLNQPVVIPEGGQENNNGNHPG